MKCKISKYFIHFSGKYTHKNNNIQTISPHTQCQYVKPSKEKNIYIKTAACEHLQGLFESAKIKNLNLSLSNEYKKYPYSYKSRKHVSH